MPLASVPSHASSQKFVPSYTARRIMSTVPVEYTREPNVVNAAGPPVSVDALATSLHVPAAPVAEKCTLGFATLVMIANPAVVYAMEAQFPAMALSYSVHVSPA